MIPSQLRDRLVSLSVEDLPLVIAQSLNGNSVSSTKMMKDDEEGNGTMAMKRVFAALAFVLLFVTSAKSGDLVDYAKAIEQALAEDDVLAADRAMTDLIFVAQEVLPFAVRNSTFVASDVRDFGIYERRETNVFAPREPIMVYAELIGYDLRFKDGRYAFDYFCSFRIRDEAGNVLGSQDNFQRISNAGDSPSRDVYLTLTYTFDGLPAGNYQLQTIVDDLVSGEQTDFTQDFVIADNG